MLSFLRHLLTPHKTNNYRARVLHNTGITLVIAGFLIFNSFTKILDSAPLHILGFTSTITADQVISEINAERLAAGLSPLSLSQKLSQAASAKASDMFSVGYWAHVSPKGVEPWDFILDTGYNYTYAGENLAKDFSDTGRMVEAWMNSPTHKDNIISSKYTETGVAVVPGNLLGEDTVLVVQLFGSTSGNSGTVTAESGTTTATSLENSVGGESTTPKEETPTIAELSQPAQVVSSPPTQPLRSRWNEFSVRKIASIAVMLLMITTLVLDLVVAESHNLSRRVGKNWAHLIFINVILITISALTAGEIL